MRSRKPPFSSDENKKKKKKKKTKAVSIVTRVINYAVNLSTSNLYSRPVTQAKSQTPRELFKDTFRISLAMMNDLDSCVLTR